MKFSNLFTMLAVAVVVLATALPANAGCRGGRCHRSGPTACSHYGGHCHR